MQNKVSVISQYCFILFIILTKIIMNLCSLSLESLLLWTYSRFLKLCAVSKRYFNKTSLQYPPTPKSKLPLPLLFGIGNDETVSAGKETCNSGKVVCSSKLIPGHMIWVSLCRLFHRWNTIQLSEKRLRTMLDLTPISAADAPATIEREAFDRCEFPPFSEKCLARV